MVYITKKLVFRNNKNNKHEIINSGIENREYGHRDPSRWPRGTLYPKTLALTSPTSDSLSVGIVGPRTKATELVRNCYLVQRDAEI
jgi:hypothetical protein